MMYEWRDNDGVMHVTAWLKAVRNAMLRGDTEHQMQSLVRCGEYRSQTGIQRKLNFVSVRTIKERSS
jgi:hypothetical protein